MIIVNPWTVFSTSSLVADPLRDQVLLYIKGQGETNTSITDSSLNPKTLTINGNTRIVKVGGESSIVYDGIGDFITTPATGTMNFTTQSFTWESWVNINFFSGTHALISTARSTGGNFGHFLVVDTNGFRFRDWVVLNGSFFSMTPLLNTWYHVACAKSGTTSKLWVNGVMAPDGVFAATNRPHTDFQIGFSFNNSNFARDFNGRMRLIRVTNGVRYAGNFNPLTETYYE